VGGLPPDDVVGEPVVIVAAGEQVTVWPEDDLPYLHAMACIGAGLDTTVRRMSAGEWERVRGELRARVPRVEIADRRRSR
jgi:hypothetical protein